MERKNGNNSSGAPKKIKFLFVSIEALIGDLAWQIKKEGHEVKYYIHEKSERDVCDGFVDKCDDWQKEIDWADVIVFDDLGFGAQADKLRKQGKLIVGGSAYTDKLEDDREFGQDEMKEVGMTIIPNYNFTNFDEAIKFVKENPGRYVLKPSGKAQNEKELLFVGNEEDGRDILELLERYKKNWGNKIKIFQLQKHVTGVEVAVGAFFNGKDFVMPVNINFEHKRLFPGNIGPSTGEMGCYKEGTKVLTRTGWKDFRDVIFEDEFATLNPETHDIEYQRPINIVKFGHHKKLLQIKNRTIDVSVTLDHNMVGVESNKFRNGDRKIEFVKAKDLPNQFIIFRSSKYAGNKKDFFILPSVTKYHRDGNAVIGKSVKEKIIKMDDWLKFFGLWLAEGWTSKSGYRVGVAQGKIRVKDKIRALLSNLPFKFTEKGDSFYCDDKQLWSYLRPLGNALEKYIPRNYLELSREQLTLLYDHMFLGDGNQSNKTRVYYTSSKRLAEDVQEILLKIGKVGIIKARNRKGAKLGKRIFKDVHTSYEVIERIEKTVSWLDKRDTSIIDYNGYVYCVEVPNHILYVKYDEKPFWCGNTSMFWSKPNNLFMATLEKIKPKLQASGYVGYFDINTIVNNKGIYPLEATSRFGYPTINIQMEGILSPLGDFIYNLASGKDFEFKTKRGFQVGVVIAAPPFPFKDAASFKRYSEDAMIIFQKPNYDGAHIADVKLIENDWRLAGTSGYALIMTGSGLTMDEARKQAYARVRNILIPNMFYRTDIGANWNLDSDMLQTWGYLY